MLMHFVMCNSQDFSQKFDPQNKYTTGCHHIQIVSLQKIVIWTVFLWIALISKRIELQMSDWSQMKGILK